MEDEAEVEVMSSEVEVMSSEEVKGRKDAVIPPGLTLLVLNVATALSGFLFGYDTGVVSGAIEEVQATLKLSTLVIGYAVGATPLMAAVFALCAAPLNVAYGRRPVLLCAAVLYASGALVVGLAQGFISLFFGRCLLGVAVGCGSMTVPIFIGEVAPPELRGRMVTLYDMMIVVGQLIAGLVNGVAQYMGRGSWRVSMSLAALPALAQFFMLFVLPESPRWLATKSRDAEAKIALTKLRTKYTEAKINEELLDVKKVVDFEKKLKEKERQKEEGIAFTKNSPWLATIATISRRRALLVGVAIMTFQAFTGINAVMYYGATIARKVGFSQKASVWAAALFDLAQLLGVVASIKRMDRLGRRPLALKSTAGTVFSLALMIIFAATLRKAVLAATILYLFAFGSGLSGVAWTLNAEVHPLVTRSHAQAIAVAANWAANALVSVFFVSAQEAYGPPIAFLPFLIITLLSLAWVFFYLPETKNKTLEDLEQTFQKPLSRHPPQLGSEPSSEAAAAAHTPTKKTTQIKKKPDEDQQGLLLRDDNNSQGGNKAEIELV